MARFSVEWCDDKTGEYRKEVVEFEDWRGRASCEGVDIGPTITITAREWAEDYAYSISDKGEYTVNQL